MPITNFTGNSFTISEDQSVTYEKKEKIGNGSYGSVYRYAGNSPLMPELAVKRYLYKYELTYKVNIDATPIPAQIETAWTNWMVQLNQYVFECQNAAEHEANVCNLILKLGYSFSDNKKLEYQYVTKTISVNNVEKIEAKLTLISWPSFYIAMPLLKGISLSYFEMNSVSEFFEIIYKLLKKVSIMHSNDLVHEDLHIGNILVVRDEKTKNLETNLVDYGLTKKKNEKFQTKNINHLYRAPGFSKEPFINTNFSDDLYTIGYYTNLLWEDYFDNSFFIDPKIKSLVKTFCKTLTNNFDEISSAIKQWKDIYSEYKKSYSPTLSQQYIQKCTIIKKLTEHHSSTIASFEHLDRWCMANQDTSALDVQLTDLDHLNQAATWNKFEGANKLISSLNTSPQHYDFTRLEVYMKIIHKLKPKPNSKVTFLTMICFFTHLHNANNKFLAQVPWPTYENFLECYGLTSDEKTKFNKMKAESALNFNNETLSKYIAACEEIILKDPKFYNSATEKNKWAFYKNLQLRLKSYIDNKITGWHEPQIPSEFNDTDYYSEFLLSTNGLLEIIKVIKTSQLFDFLESLPDKVNFFNNTKVKEQKQPIANLLNSDARSQFLSFVLYYQTIKHELKKSQHLRNKEEKILHASKITDAKTLQYYLKSIKTQNEYYNWNFVSALFLKSMKNFSLNREDLLPLITFVNFCYDSVCLKVMAKRIAYEISVQYKSHLERSKIFYTLKDLPHNFTNILLNEFYNLDLKSNNGNKFSFFYRNYSDKKSLEKSMKSNKISL